jgi:hypothetical protein
MTCLPCLSTGLNHEEIFTGLLALSLVQPLGVTTAAREYRQANKQESHQYIIAVCLFNTNIDKHTLTITGFPLLHQYLHTVIVYLYHCLKNNPVFTQQSFHPHIIHHTVGRLKPKRLHSLCALLAPLSYSIHCYATAPDSKAASSASTPSSSSR